STMREEEFYKHRNAIEARGHTIGKNKAGGGVNNHCENRRKKKQGNQTRRKVLASGYRKNRQIVKVLPVRKQAIPFQNNDGTRDHHGVHDEKILIRKRSTINVEVADMQEVQTERRVFVKQQDGSECRRHRKYSEQGGDGKLQIVSFTRAMKYAR